MCALRDGRLVSGSLDKTIKVWEVSKGTCLFTLKGHARTIRALLELQDGRLASGAGDHMIKLWPAPLGAATAPDGSGVPVGPHTLEGHIGEVRALAVLPDGRLASASDDVTIRLWR